VVHSALKTLSVRPRYKSTADSNLEITIGLRCQTNPHARHDTRGEAGTLFGPLEPTVTTMLIVRYYLYCSFKESYGSGVGFLKNLNIRGIFALF
jgi:hypothetical protein